MAEKKILNDMERMEKNKQIAESYYDVYSKKAVKDGAVYDKWVFSPHATYWSPYFGNNKIDLGVNPISVEDSATKEALSYSVEFKDWGPIDFECFPSIEGVAWKTHFGGHRKKDNEFMDFFAYSYIKTNEYGEITHWETHVNSDYNDFLDVAIGVHGPFKNGSGPYMKAVTNKLMSAGIDISAFAHKKKQDA